MNIYLLKNKKLYLFQQNLIEDSQKPALSKSLLQNPQVKVLHFVNVILDDGLLFGCMRIFLFEKCNF